MPCGVLLALAGGLAIPRAGVAPARLVGVFGAVLRLWRGAGLAGRVGVLGKADHRDLHVGAADLGFPQAELCRALVLPDAVPAQAGVVVAQGGPVLNLLGRGRGNKIYADETLQLMRSLLIR